MDSFTIRKLTTGASDLAQYNALLRYAFQITNEDLSRVGWDEEEIRDAKYPILDRATVWGWFDEEMLVSQISLYPMRVNIHGKIFDMAGVTGVATYPEYSGKGLMKQLILRSLEEMRASNQTISFLYPYSIPYYRRMGWEIISDKMRYTLKDTQLPKTVPSSGYVERVATDHEDYIQLHNTFAKKRHGCLIRDTLAWEEYWRWEVDDIIVALYYNAQDKPKGYLVYLLENEIFKIKEMIALDEEARHGLWNYVSAHFSMVQEVSGAQYTNEPLAFLLEDSEIRETIRPYFMARIVDVASFLKNYPFQLPEKEGAICFCVTDPMAEWNNDCFAVSWDLEKKVFHCEKGKPQGKKIDIDIQTLTTMLMSYKRPTYLKRIERLAVGEETLQLLEQLVPQEEPYFSDYF